ncbi:MAG: hypothetical protein JXQ71_11550, partial [Verrucomicrobia bacterium]|nr:hypothetical protein [Verrucomicrobiota bacterium]
MTRATISAMVLIALAAGAARAQHPDPALNEAIAESIRRDAMRVELTNKLVQAGALQQEGALFGAAAAYDDCLYLVRQIGQGVEPHREQAARGAIEVRLLLADQAYRRESFREATNHAMAVIRLDPANKTARLITNNVYVNWLAVEARRPNQDTIDQIPKIIEDRVTVEKLVQDGKVLYEAGKYDEAESKLLEATRRDPHNRGAIAYLDLVMDKQYRKSNILRENWSKSKIMEVAQAWNQHVQRHDLPIPNPYAHTNFVKTGKGRTVIYDKLQRIRIDKIGFERIPLSEVIVQLSDDAMKRDPEKKGINFILSDHAEPVGGEEALDPVTGLPAEGETPSLGDTEINLRPEIHNVTLQEALEAITKVASRPIKYSIEDAFVLITHRIAETPPLYTRFFRIDPNTFFQGLQGVTSYSFGTSGGGGYGGGGYGGGGYG